jgi:protein tyrosine phosphatase
MPNKSKKILKSKTVNRKTVNRKTLKIKVLEKKKNKLLQVGGGPDEKIKTYAENLDYLLNIYDLKLIALYMFINGDKDISSGSRVSDTDLFEFFKLNDIDVNNKVIKIIADKIENLRTLQYIHLNERENITNFHDWLDFQNTQDYPCIITTGERKVFPRYLFSIDQLNLIKTLFDIDGVLGVQDTNSILIKLKSKTYDTKLIKKTNNNTSSLESNTKQSNNVADNKVLHYWFKIWPDDNIPQEEAYINYITEIYYDDIKKNGGNTLIHCSAGVGRTGVVYMTLFYMIIKNFSKEQIPGQNQCKLGSYKGEQITVEFLKDTIILARIDVRQLLVKERTQFMFLCDLFSALGTPEEKEESWIKINEKRYGNSEQPSFNIALAAGNKAKNRYLDILPYDENYYYDTEIEYVNASKAYLMLNFKEDVIFILTQCPKHNTINDFWKMVKNAKVKRIIMVTGLIENGKPKCDKYFKLDGSVIYKPTGSNEDNAQYEIRHFIL